jgi:hypothetical protein
MEKLARRQQRKQEKLTGGTTGDYTDTDVDVDAELAPSVPDTDSPSE